MKQALLICTIALIALTTAVAPSFAAENSAEQKQSGSASSSSECTVSGAYGTCATKANASVTQEERQKILAGQGGGDKYHKPVDTALDTTAIMYIMVAAFLGLGASVALVKLK